MRHFGLYYEKEERVSKALGVMCQYILLHVYFIWILIFLIVFIDGDQKESILQISGGVLEAIFSCFNNETLLGIAAAVGAASWLSFQ